MPDKTETETPETAAAETPVDPKVAEEKAAEEKAGSETVSDLADLKDIAGDTPSADAADIAATAEVPLREQELDAQGRAYATGG